jgi:uncharacterized membrane protein
MVADSNPPDSYRPDSKYTRSSLWSQHPGVPSAKELTPGERAADTLRNGMGSWAFVTAAMVFLSLWMAFNSQNGFDPYPFILLNLLLSCLAAMQGAILLIAAKRQDQIASELAMHDYETNLEADGIIKEVHRLTLQVHQLLMQDDAALRATASNPPSVSNPSPVLHSAPKLVD